jgi:hypothetical protein
MNTTPPLNLVPNIQQPPVQHSLKRSESKISQQAEFERRQFRNAVILCDVRGTQVEYTIPSKDKESIAGDIQLERATGACRICLVREKKMYKDGKVVYNLAIWSFSDDITVRVSQKRMFLSSSTPPSLTFPSS